MRFLEERPGTYSATQVIQEDELESRGNMFTWLIVIMVLLGLNIGSWSFCNMVFGHPEHPFSYGLLTKLEKLEPLTGFTSTGVAGGKFRSAKDLYTEAYPFKKSQLRAYNGILMRNYLWNYKDRSPATFIFGNFTVDEVKALTPLDQFQKGIIVTATAYKFPDAKVKLILPTAEPIENASLYYKPGDKLEIAKSSMAATVLNAQKSGPDDPMIFTAVPLITKSSGGGDLAYKTPSGTSLKLRTPEWLNID